jgi:adenine-specific DNA-methyltransferase
VSNNNNESLETIKTALQSFESKSLREASLSLLRSLGYQSEKTITVPESDPEAFLKLLDDHNRDETIDKGKALFEDWKKADILFQLTDEELSNEISLFKDDAVNSGLLKSYLFFAIELKNKDYARGKLTAIARQLNRVFPMPVMVFIKHHDLLSIAVINRRLNKRDSGKDVLGKVTIIRDISLENPHRGHLDIFNSFALSSLIKKTAIHDFDTLHTAWEEIFNVELLNKRFYKEIFKWYFWALPEIRFPDDLKPDGLTREQEARYYEKLSATGLIRLLTRLIFCWFLKEKGLIPETLFDEEKLAGILKSLDDDQPTYHQGILQNLFFATLNQRMGEKYRGFAKDEGVSKNKDAYGIDNLYRYESLFKDPDSVLTNFEDIPFLNGGLFECLDHADDKGKKIYVDGFSRNKKKRACIPNRFFFGKGEVNIGEVTGEGRQGTEKAKGLIHILSQFKFTIIENTPIDQEIALDPELLGKVFENLLASYNEETKTTARKQTGSFYTPRPIVDYMVDESLKAHLTTALVKDQGMKEEDARAGLDNLFAYTEKQHIFEDDEVKTLIKAIDNCKILDPACGSGAFPMGILHKLVHILANLDPNNEKWKQTQLGKLDSANMREELERTFENNSDDYGRKLYLIENCLYGVDIQPIAIQLSKLRFFISLICDQKTNRNKGKNHGVKPLPNLETKFVAADTLIGLAKDTQMNLFKSSRVVEIERKLQQVRHDYFAVQNRHKKLGLQSKDKLLRDSLADELMQEAFADQNTSLKLAKWNPYDPHVAADFFEPLWMFDCSMADGFDIVIGNPPYIQIQKFTKPQKDKWVAQHYETYSATADIYCLFYERGSKLLKTDGMLCYITSNNWMRANYGMKTRKYISSTMNALKVIDFGMSLVFSSAAALTNVLLARKTASSQSTKCCYVLDGNEALLDLSIYFEKKSVELPALDENSWVVISKDRQRIKLLVEEQGIPLKEWDINIYRGVLTGYNDAFYITAEQRKALIAEDPACEEFIVPLLRGRFVERYGTKWDGTWMIATFPTFRYNPDLLPQPIIKYLRAFKERLEPKPRGWSGSNWSGRKTGSYQWFETQDSISYQEEFYKPKIIYPNMTKYLPFYFDKDGYYFGNQKCFIISGSTARLPFLTAFLNSSIFKCCFKDNFPELLGNTYELSKIFFEKIPVKQLDQKYYLIFDTLISLVQRTKESDQESSAAQNKFIEDVIDACVMEVYFYDHLAERDLLLMDDLAALFDSFNKNASEEKQRDFIIGFHRTANAPSHPIRNKLIRLTADSPDLLAVIKKEGRV